jgi:hypothetical protein
MNSTHGAFKVVVTGKSVILGNLFKEDIKTNHRVVYEDIRVCDVVELVEGWKGGIRTNDPTRTPQQTRRSLQHRSRSV